MSRDYIGMQNPLPMPSRVFRLVAGKPVPPDLWAAAAVLLAPALAVSGTHEPDDVAAAVAVGDMQLWLADGLAIVTEIAVYPQLKALNFCFVGGEALRRQQKASDADTPLSPAGETLLSAVSSFARRHGCRRLNGGGRAGWGRALEFDGWKKTTEYYKDFEK